jgi:GDP-L-fucose synthase
MEKTDKILVLGSEGLVGSSIKRELERQGIENLLLPTRLELNLTIQKDVLSYFNVNKPQYVFMAAAKVGGIEANNNYRADFIWENLSIQNNVFEASFKHKIKKLLFLGSSCIYPKECPQPIKEEYLLSGKLEPTNEPYAIAKIAGLKTAESFRRQYNQNFFSVMPTNLYGVGDNFHPQNSHVIPGMIQRMKSAIDNNHKEFEVWGSGKPKREFLYVDDLANACVFLMNYKGSLPDYINVGTGIEITIEDLAKMIARLMGLKGTITLNKNRPDGTMRKVLDVTKIESMGWKHTVPLETGLKWTIDYYLSAPSVRSYFRSN